MSVGVFRHRPLDRLVGLRRKRWIGTVGAVSVTVSPGKAALTLTGYSPTIILSHLVQPGKAALTITGYAPKAAVSYTILPGKAGLTLTGYAPTITIGVVVTPGKAALTLTGYAPTVTASRTVRPEFPRQYRWGTQSEKIKPEQLIRQLNTALRGLMHDMDAGILVPHMKRGLRWVGQNYTLTALDFGLVVEASGGARTVTLPPAADVPGEIYWIKKGDSSANAVTIDGNASETIDGSATQSLANQHDVKWVQSDGINWYIMADK